MNRTDVEARGRRTTWRNPVLRFEGHCRAPAEAVYDLLADLPSHLDWAGERQSTTTRLLSLDAPPGPAGVGVEFVTTGSDGKVATWTDRSVVTEATRAEVFEFVTDGRRDGKAGSLPWLLTATHRYVIVPDGAGCRVTYTEELTRLDGAPWMLRARGVNRLVFWMSAKFMRRGFDSLIALAEERAGGTPRSHD
jgi:Polyketide cyclase / dehydrase and lipid transport